LAAGELHERIAAEIDHELHARRDDRQRVGTPRALLVIDEERRLAIEYSSSHVALNLVM
jgi:type VI protein secretion system component VasF